jgi:flagellar export protein FliJ
MSRFRFRLERLASVRKVQEQLERERWLAAELRAREAEAAAARLRDAVASGEAELRLRQGAGTLRAAELLHGQAAVERLQGLLRRARERARSARFQAERLRAPWEERRKELRGLERLEQRARRDWLRAELRRDAARMDEVASARARRAAGPDPGGPPRAAQGAAGVGRSSEAGPPELR